MKLKKRYTLLPKPGFVIIHCPTCQEKAYMNVEVLKGPPQLNVNRCLKCFTEVRLLSVQPLVVGVIREPSRNASVGRDA